MADALATLFPILFLACAPLLLVVRFFSPRLMPWWAVFLCASALGWLFIVLGEHFDKVSYAQCIERRFEDPDGFAIGRNYPGCPFLFLDGAYAGNLEFGWVTALIYFFPWLAIYGVVHLIRKRVTQARHA